MLKSIEMEILKKGLSGEGVVLQVLREQAMRAKVIRRDITGAGFLTKIDIGSSKNWKKFRDFELTDIEGDSNSLINGFGCVIFVRDSRIRMIECFAYDEDFPYPLLDFRIETIGQSPRNFDSFLE